MLNNQIGDLNVWQKATVVDKFEMLVRYAVVFGRFCHQCFKIVTNVTLAHQVSKSKGWDTGKPYKNFS